MCCAEQPHGQADQPYRQNPLLRLSYSLYAPIYDLTVERAMREALKRSLSALPTDAPKRVRDRVA